MTKTNKILLFLSIMLALVLVVPSVGQAQVYCTYHSYQSCSGNSLYWYDSCGNQQDLAQYCQNGCYGNSCSYDNYNNYNNYNNYGACTYHAYKLCVGNNIYWFDGCNMQQDLVQGCYNGQTCQYIAGLGATCSNYIINPVLPPVQPTYVAHANIACLNNSIHWFDSNDAESGLYKSCSDNNECTTDTCSGNICIHTAIANCGITQPPVQPPVQNNCGNQLCEVTLGETTTSCPADCKINTNTANVAVSFFTKQDANSSQWQKTTQVGSNGTLYFMISVANSSTTKIDNVTISANIPSEVSSLGNLKLDSVAVSGDIVSGINIGSINPSTTKSITFEGKTTTISTASTKQATVTSNVSGATQSDTVSIDFTLSQTGAAAVSNDTTTSGGFLNFLKRWYLWILGALVLIFLFTIVFKRFSKEV